MPRTEAEVKEAPQFTPGPWRLHDMERATIVAGRPGGEVANCCNGFGDQDANARLIAAAPQLFEALSIAEYAMEQAVDDICDINMEGLNVAIKKARAALKAATGEQ